MNRRGEFEPEYGGRSTPGGDPYGTATGEAASDPYRDPGESARTASKRQRSLGSLFGDLTSETRTLVQQEVALARAEISEKVTLLQRSTLFMALGGAFAVAALLTLVAALNNGLIALLNEVVALEVAVWLAPLILALVLGGIAWLLIDRGREKLKRERLTLERTADSLREDTRWIKEKVS